MSNSNMNLTHFRLRKLIGATGMLLPFIVWIGKWELLPSISDYYYTYMGVAFITILMWCSAFLMAYRGYEESNWLTDNGITTAGGILLMFTVIFPTPFEEGGPCTTPVCFEGQDWAGYLHFGSASIFFILMGLLAFYNFTLPKLDSGKKHSPNKAKRNKIYRFCARGIWITLGLTLVGYVIRESDYEFNKYFTYVVFVGELVVLQFFGFAWLVKGKALYDIGFQKEDDPDRSEE